MNETTLGPNAEATKPQDAVVFDGPHETRTFALTMLGFRLKLAGRIGRADNLTRRACIARWPELARLRGRKFLVRASELWDADMREALAGRPDLADKLRRAPLY